MSTRRWAVWGTVVLGAVATLELAAHALVDAPPSSHVAAGAAVIALLAWGANRSPVPVGQGASMSLDVVFVLCAAVMYGAAVAALIAATVCIFENFRAGEHPIKAVFNGAVFALMGGAAGLAAHVHPRGDLGLVATVALAAAAAYVTNVGLVLLMVAHARIHEFVARAWEATQRSAIPYALSLSVVPLFIVAWSADPYVAMLSVVPLAGIGLHMRSLEQSRKATELALTDPLTGLGNRRHLNERLQRELDRAEETLEPLSICILDLDGFKGINDTRGHEAGDEALVAVAGAFRQGGEAFRLGGDEFVLLLPNQDHYAAEAVAAAVRERVAAFGLSVSAGTATYDGNGAGRADLLRTADAALYEDKLVVSA
ncbi:MAG TPA: GGDEF domain-containing protein [Gaiellaceae bacterium]|nr:GGDEF domain-containing protein [Gaiellaceae bacterium]